MSKLDDLIRGMTFDFFGSGQHKIGIDGTATGGICYD